MTELYSTGEVIDKIQPGEMATSTSNIDKGAVILYDNEGWLMIKYPKNTYFKYDFNFKEVEEGEKRWVIAKRDEEFDMIMLVFKDDVYVIDLREDSE